MKVHIKTAFFLLAVHMLSGCHSKPDKIIGVFESMPHSIASRHLDSLAWLGEWSIRDEKKAFPVNQKNRQYFEERPYFDSSGQLQKVTVYEYRSDSFTSYTDFNYWRGQFIKMRTDRANRQQSLGIAYYIFSGNKLIDSSCVLMMPENAESILKKAAEFKERFKRY